MFFIIMKNVRYEFLYPDMPPITKLANVGTLASWIDTDIDAFSFSHASL